MTPIIRENSRIPVWLSRLSPINIHAIVLWPWIICRSELDETSMRHELIHWHQYRELWVVGFLAIYLWDYLTGLVKYRSGEQAYRKIRFEQEAYARQGEADYLEMRPRLAWRDWS